MLAIPVADRKKYLSLLLEADPNEALIQTYIETGDLFAIKRDKKVIGVALFTFPQQRTVELKNIAIKQTIRGQGYGKTVIQQAQDLYREKGYHEMIVGTANSSIANIAFYQKIGFRLRKIEPDFFLHYPELIFENGIQAKDKLIFIKQLR